MMPILHTFGRLAFYIALVVLSAHMVRRDARWLVEGRKFVEHSHTEWAQAVFILLSAGVLLFIARRFVTLRAVSLLGGGGLVVVLIREMDAWFDTLYHGAWAPFALAAMAATLFFVYRERRDFRDSLTRFFATPAFGYIAAGGLTIFVFSRLIGAKAVWAAVFQVETLSPMSPSRWVKNAVEEGVELFGYCLVFCGTVELLAWASRHLNTRPRNP